MSAHLQCFLHHTASLQRACREGQDYRDIFAALPNQRGDTLSSALMKLLNARFWNFGAASEVSPRPPAVYDAQSSRLAVFIEGAQWYWYEHSRHLHSSNNCGACPQCLAHRACKPQHASASCEAGAQSGTACCNASALCFRCSACSWVHRVTARDWAEGGTIAVVMEPSDQNCSAVTVHWPWQGILAGEAQFSLLMRVISHNLAERGFDAAVPLWEWRRDPTLPAARPLPDSLALPADQPLRVLVNVALGQTYFCVEAARRMRADESNLPGRARLLACALLSNAKVQYKMTTGAATNLSHLV